MTEINIYDAWTTDEDILDILCQLGLFTQDQNLQSLLEQAVSNPRDSYPSRKKLGEKLGQKFIPLPTIRAIANAVEGKSWKTVGQGADPVIASDGIHRNGLSHLQSLQDNTA